MNDGAHGPEEKRSFSEASEGKSTGILGEFWAFLRENKKWWLAPIIVVLLLVGVLIVLGGTALAPFMYPIF